MDNGPLLSTIETMTTLFTSDPAYLNTTLGLQIEDTTLLTEKYLKYGGKVFSYSQFRTGLHLLLKKKL